MSEREAAGCGCMVAVLIAVALIAAKCTHDHDMKQSAAKEAEIADNAATLAAGSYRAANGDAGCTSTDCGGHEAGWEWARAHHATIESECKGSASFVEGCKAYVGLGEAAVDDYHDEHDKP